MVSRKMLRVTLVKSLIGRHIKHKACAIGLGLKRIHQTVEVLDTPENRGMVNKIFYMVNLKEE